LCISLHDVAPATWPACERVLAAVAEVAPVAVALLIVPRYRGVDSASDPTFLQAIERRLARGDEAVLHGYTHVDDRPLKMLRPVDVLWRRIYTAREGEFSALDRMEACRRLFAGIAWFQRRGWPLHGFVAPAWLMSRAALAAVQDTPLRYAGLRRHLMLLCGRRLLAAPSLCYSTRAGWRRTASLHWNSALGLFNASSPLLRLALHPHDADYDAVRLSWQRWLQAQVHARMVLTEAQVAAHAAASPDPRYGRRAAAA
jgi:hypothetical protein